MFDNFAPCVYVVSLFCLFPCGLAAFIFLSSSFFVIALHIFCSFLFLFSIALCLCCHFQYISEHSASLFLSFVLLLCLFFRFLLIFLSCLFCLCDVSVFGFFCFISIFYWNLFLVICFFLCHFACIPLLFVVFDALFPLCGHSGPVSGLFKLLCTWGCFAAFVLFFHPPKHESVPVFNGTLPSSG